MLSFLLFSFFVFPFYIFIYFSWEALEGRSLIGSVREWDFFFFRSFSFLRSGGYLILLEGCPWLVRPNPLSECYWVSLTLYTLPFRLLSLPPLYLRLGVPDPYLDRRLLPLLIFGNPNMCHSGFNSSSHSEEELSSFNEEPSSSGTPELAMSPPSLTPSDRNNEGVVPERAAVQGEGQRYYVLSEPSGD